MFRTAPVQPQAGGMINGLIALAVVMVILAAVGRGQTTSVKLEA